MVGVPLRSLSWAFSFGEGRGHGQSDPGAGGVGIAAPRTWWLSAPAVAQRVVGWDAPTRSRADGVAASVVRSGRPNSCT